MESDFIQDEGFYKLLSQNYTHEEIKVFIMCIMSKNISSEDLMKSLTAIGVGLKLDHELYYEVGSEEEDFPTSEFQEFLDTSVNYIMYNKDYFGWIRFLRKGLLHTENYELLHTLQLESTWNI